MIQLENQYKRLLRKALKSGVKRNDRTGVGCSSLFAEKLSFNLLSGEFPIITGKKIFFKSIQTEFLWFINGETNIKRFQEAGVPIWDQWADSEGNLGPVYGFQMLNFNGQGINQLEQVIDSIKNNSDSRRHIISLWNPVQLPEMALPPCYHSFQFFVEKEKLHLHVLQRSADLFIGVPYDLGLFSLFLIHVAILAGKVPARLELTLIDAHVYSNHTKQIKRYLKLPTYDFPSLIFHSPEENFLINYQHGPFINAPVAV